jgi:PAS domain S-box-containing protein
MKNTDTTPPHPETESAHYRLLFEAAPDAILVVGMDGVIRMNNKQAERLLEASEGELVGMSVEKLVPLSARKHHVELRSGFVRSKHSRPMGVGLSLHAVKLNGREFPVEISLSSTDGVSGKETIVVMRDITERLAARRTEGELLRAKALTKVTQIVLRERDFQVLCDQLVQLVFQPLDADSVTIAHCLNASGEFTIRSAAGADAEQSLGVSFGTAPLSVEQSLPILVGDVKESSHIVFPVAAAAGYRSMVSAPVFEYEKLVGTIVVASRTPHKFRSEDVAFVEAVTNIVSTALQRASAEEKLVKSQRLESLGQLTGGVAHDFNNLLTVISGNLQLLESPLEEVPDANRRLLAAQRAARRGAELTAKLLAFARRQTLRPEAIDVHALLSEFHVLLARTLGANIAIDVKCAKDTPGILVDSGALEDALLNLAVNARDAMANGGALTLAAQPYDVAATDAMVSSGELVPGHYVRIDVSDTGVGMTHETIARAFEPFFTTKPVGKGSGLGLAMVYGFAKQSAGHIALRSQMDVGTTISLYLPVASRDVSRAESKRATDKMVGKSEKILIIEDDDDVRDIATAFLEDLGYQTVAVSNKASAIASLREHSDVVLVFSDVMLGGNETGPQAWKALAEVKPSLHLLYASGYAKSALPLQLGLDDRTEFLKKPYSRDELAGAVKRALARQSTN